MNTNTRCTRLTDSSTLEFELARNSNLLRLQARSTSFAAPETIDSHGYSRLARAIYLAPIGIAPDRSLSNFRGVSRR